MDETVEPTWLKIKKRKNALKFWREKILESAYLDASATR